MADAVTNVTLYSDQFTHAIHITNICDTTGESAVAKIDKSGLAVDGAEPSYLAIQEVQWSIQGFTNVRLLWDHTTDDVALILGPGQGCLDFATLPLHGLADPQSAGGTGDLVLTTVGNSAGDTYDITIKARLVK